jgi:hypothetical protein
LVVGHVLYLDPPWCVITLSPAHDGQMLRTKMGHLCITADAPRQG